MQIIDNKALLLKVKNPNKITTVIPKSKQVGNNEVLVKWGLEEAQVLKNLRIKDVPSPITAHYKWTGKYKPFDHQIKTAEFLTLHRRAFCFNEQGTGKTSSAIWAADYLINIGVIKRVLVICPLSVMQSAWGGDLFKFATHRTYAIAHSHSKEKRIKAAKSDADFVITNFDGVEILKDYIKEFDLIIVDEANAYKNVQTRRWKTLNSVIKPDMWLWMMTGTPASQSPIDAYGLAKLINPTGIPKFYSAFRDMVMVKVTNFKWVPKETAQSTVYDVLQPAIRFTKEECLDLPDMTYTEREVPLTPQQKKFYEELKKQMRTVAAGEEITTPNAAASLNKLLQLSCGAVYSDTGEVIAFDAKNRLAALLEVVEEASHKVIVFVPFRHAIEIIAEELNQRGISAEIVNGAVSANKRAEIFNKFQTESDPKVFV